MTRPVKSCVSYEASTHVYIWSLSSPVSRADHLERQLSYLSDGYSILQLLQLCGPTVRWSGDIGGRSCRRSSNHHPNHVGIRMQVELETQ